MDYNMTPNESTMPAKVVYQEFTLKQKLIPTLLLAVAAGLMLCLIGPLDIFLNNQDEFLFAGSDFALWCSLFSILVAGLVCAILLPLKGRWFDVAYALLFALTVMLFVQGNYLNTGLNSLAGDGQGENANQAMLTVINTFVWILVTAGCIVAILLIKNQYREIVLTVGIVAMVAVICMQLVPLGVNMLTTPRQDKEDSDETMRFLTYENMDEIGKDRNVFYFVVDRFDANFYETYLQEDPELKERLDGFTYYSDMVSFYPRTYPAVPYMLTGIEHDFLDARTDYLDEAYEQSEFLNRMHDEGYQINVYTDEYYGYHDANSMKKYVSNISHDEVGYQIVKKFHLSWDMVRLSMYRYFPFCAKSVVGNISTPSFQQYVVYDSEYEKFTTDMRNAYLFLQDNPPRISDVKKNFSFIHVEGCHIPNPYNEKFEPAVTPEEQYSSNVALKQSFHIIELYLDRLKELGLYKDATIIIAGDHGSLLIDDGFAGADTVMLNEREKPFLTALFVKPSGSENAPLTESSAPIAQADIIPAILESEGIQTDSAFGRSLFDVEEGEMRVRRSVFHRRLGGNDEEVIFKIIGSGKNLNNWMIESRDKFVGDLYN